MIVAVFLPRPIYLLGAWKRTHSYMETYLSIYSTALFDVVQCDLSIYSTRPGGPTRSSLSGPLPMFRCPDGATALSGLSLICLLYTSPSPRDA